MKEPKSGKTQGGGAEGQRKKKKPSHRGTVALNTMGMGHSSKQDGASGSMGKHQSTGDGGASRFNS